MFQLSASVGETVPDQLQVRDLLVDDGQLFPHRNQGSIDGIIFHMFLNLIQGKSHFFHNQNSIQIVNLFDGIIPVLVVRIYIGRFE